MNGILKQRFDFPVHGANGAARRLLYGSDYPFFNQGSMMLPLKQSTLPEADIARIAGGNLNQLLEEAQL